MKIVEVKEVYGTKWLAFKNAKYINKEGKEAFWDYVSRKGDRKVVTAICRSTQTGKYLLISQPRVSTNKIMIEFPAGLIDPGESIETAGLRELKEETGYDGKVLRTSPFVVKSAGLSDESTAVVELDVDEAAVGKSEMEVSEDIQSFWITPQEFEILTKTVDPEKTMFDSHVWFYFMGVLSANKQKPKKATKKSTKKSSKKSSKK